MEGLKEKEKEPPGPGCRDYFWLVCRFVDSISKEDAKSDSVRMRSVFMYIHYMFMYISIPFVSSLNFKSCLNFTGLFCFCFVFILLFCFFFDIKLLIDKMFIPLLIFLLSSKTALSIWISWPNRYHSTCWTARFMRHGMGLRRTTAWLGCWTCVLP